MSLLIRNANGATIGFGSQSVCIHKLAGKILGQALCDNHGYHDVKFVLSDVYSRSQTDSSTSKATVVYTPTNPPNLH